MYSVRWLCATVFVLTFGDVKYVTSQFSLNVGDSCTLRSGGSGTCKTFEDCDGTLLSKEPGDPVVCAWGEDAVVCCPGSGSGSRGPTVRKSEQKCNEYGRIRCKSSNVTQTILRGEVVESPREFPHMALLGYGDPSNPTWQCGGTLISELYVLTAAHCLRAADGTKPVVVDFGFLNKQRKNEFNTYQRKNIVKRIKHPGRKLPELYSDVALLQLDSPVAFSDNVFPACLHTSPELNVAQATATGWGDIYNKANAGSDALMKVKLKLTTHEQCQQLFPTNRKLTQGILKEQQFCAGNDGRDTCQGDSGGPLQVYHLGEYYCMHDIVGVTSFGTECGKAPGVFARVAHFVPWIETVVWP